jgi:hypothetical protein
LVWLLAKESRSFGLFLFAKKSHISPPYDLQKDFLVELPKKTPKALTSPFPSKKIPPPPPRAPFPFPASLFPFPFSPLPYFFLILALLCGLWSLFYFRICYLVIEDDEVNLMVIKAIKSGATDLLEGLWTSRVSRITGASLKAYCQQEILLGVHLITIKAIKSGATNLLEGLWTSWESLRLP